MVYVIGQTAKSIALYIMRKGEGLPDPPTVTVAGPIAGQKPSWVIDVDRKFVKPYSLLRLILREDESIDFMWRYDGEFDRRHKMTLSDPKLLQVITKLVFECSEPCRHL